MEGCSWLRAGFGCLLFLVALGFAQKHVGKFFPVEGEGEVGEDAEEGEEDDDGNPEGTLLAIEGLGEDAGNDAGKDAGPDEGEGEENYPIPSGGLEAEMVEEM